MGETVIQAVMTDYEGNIWTGTGGSGVNMLCSQAFKHYTLMDGLFGHVTALCAVGKDIYLVGTANGLYVFSPNTGIKFRKLLYNTQLANVNVSSIANKNGVIWIAAQDGIYQVLSMGSDAYEMLPMPRNQNFPPTIKHFDKLNDSLIISPQKIIHDSKGRTWIATYGSGVFCIDKAGSSTHFYTKNKFPTDNILTVFEDSKGTIWFGTQDAGVVKYDCESFIAFKGFADKAVWSITEDQAGTLYFGTGESGMYGYKDGKLNQTTVTDGLSADFVQAMYFDKATNSLWLGGEKGLDRIKLPYKESKQTVKRYNTAQGFRPTTINANALLSAADGSLLIGTVNGLSRYIPSEDRSQPIPPKLELTGIRLFYQNADFTPYCKSFNSQTFLPENLELPYNKNHLTFDIQALTTKEARYVFQLEGQDENWSEPTENNALTYTNLAPGKTYTFKAKAIGEEGKLSSAQVSFSLYIRPPWWNSWWFNLAVIIAFGGSMMAFIRLREKVLRDQNKALELKVTERTAEIEKQKTVLERLLGEKELLLKEIHHRVKNNLQTISSMLMLQSAGLKDEHAKKAIAESQSRVKSIALVHQKLYQTDGLEKAELHAFVQELTDQVKTLFHSSANNVIITLSIPETYILIDKAIPLGLILNELLTNSYKYAFAEVPQGEIVISLNPATDCNSSKLKLIYKDNGPGMDEALLAGKPTTLGLRIIRLLSQQIGASVEYSKEKGSVFKISF